MTHHAGVPLLLALVVVACAGKSVDLDGPGHEGIDTGGGGAGTAVTLVTVGEADGYAIAVDSKRLYWLSREFLKVSVLKSCLKENCGTTQLTYPTETKDVTREARVIKVRGGTVYWLAWQEQTSTSTPSLRPPGQNIWACAVAGCAEPELIVAGAGQGDFEVDANEVYFTSPSGNGLLACPVSGCEAAPRTLPEWTGHEPSSLGQAYLNNFPRAAGDSLFWVSKSGELVRLRKDGSSPLELLATGPQVATALAANESHIYWPVPLLAGSIGRCAYPGCFGGLQVFAPSLRRPVQVVVEGEALFFQHQLTTGDWQIASCSLTNCAEPRTISALPAGAFPSANTLMAVDEASVYFFAYEPNPPQRLLIKRVRQ